MCSTRAPRVRQCQMNGCYDAALTGQIFCNRHVMSPEGVRFHKEVQAIATWLVAHEEAPTVEDVERQKLRERFQRRVERGDFNTLLDAATGTILAQAAAQRHHQLELGALRFAIARTISEERDAHRMSLAVARLSNAISRLTLAEHATRDWERPEVVQWIGEQARRRAGEQFGHS